MARPERLVRWTTSPICLRRSTVLAQRRQQPPRQDCASDACGRLRESCIESNSNRRCRVVAREISWRENSKIFSSLAEMGQSRRPQKTLVRYGLRLRLVEKATRSVFVHYTPRESRWVSSSTMFYHRQCFC